LKDDVDAEFRAVTASLKVFCFMGYSEFAVDETFRLSRQVY
jgi:hypothetical protein